MSLIPGGELSDFYSLSQTELDKKHTLHSGTLLSSICDDHKWEHPFPMQGALLSPFVFFLVLAKDLLATRFFFQIALYSLVKQKENYGLTTKVT